MLKEFKEFALRGNVLDLAVAVILGIAFGAVINSLVNDVLMNLIAALVGRPDFNGLTFSVGNGVIRYGAFLTALVNFLLIAAVLFLVLKAVARMFPPKTEPASDAPAPSDEAILLTEIRDLLRARRP